MSDSLTTIQMIAAYFLPLLFAVTVHEVAHGYIAYLLGDKTARILGRLTLNPLPHIDLFYTIIMPFALLLLSGGRFVFGAAKPVPINSRNLGNLKRDLALIAVAGPASNFIMAIIWAGIAKLAIHFTPYFVGAPAILAMGVAGIAINIMLMVLNLLPIPQLDGGHIIASILPQNIAVQYERLTPYGLYILLLLLALGVLDVVMRPMVGYFVNLISGIFGLNLQF